MEKQNMQEINQSIEVRTSSLTDDDVMKMIEMKLNKGFCVTLELDRNENNYLIVFTK